MLKQNLQQKIQQRITPQQIQLIKLLEVPTLELEEKIKKELEENPALEEDKEFSAEDEVLNTEKDEFSIEDYYGDEEGSPDYKLYINNKANDENKNEIPFLSGTSFQEQLIEQLRLIDLKPNVKKLAKYIIGNLEEDGYLKRKPEEISDDLLFQEGKEIDIKDIEHAISIIQNLEPAGIGAQNLQECLLLQIQRKKQDKYTNLAKEILENYFEEFSKKHYEKIISSLEISKDDLKKTIKEITKLNPKPGNFTSNIWEKNIQQITPDFILENVNGELYLHLNNKNTPELRVNNDYINLIKQYTENKNPSKEIKDAAFFIKHKLDAAKDFIEAIKQRQTTLLKTMNAIINLQKEYFTNGSDSSLKPMIMKDIAEIAGYDISTISRVANSKYIQTEFGIFPLKHFFTEATQHKSGEEVSTREVKNILLAFIEQEDKKKPLTDEELSKQLKEKGYQIARRTVAKYREQLNIPVARMRKTF